MDNPNKPFWWPDAQGFTIGAILVIAAMTLFWRMGHPTAVDDKVLDMMITIIFGTALVAIVNYLFGSSRSSAAKDDTQNKIVERLTPTVPPSPTAPVSTTTTVTDDATTTKTEPAV